MCEARKKMDNRNSFDLFFDKNSKNWFDSAYIKKMFKKRKYLIELDKKDILSSPGEELTDCYYVDMGIMISYETEGKNRRVYDFFDSGMFIFLEETLMGYPSILTYEALTPVKLYSISDIRVRKLWQNSIKFANYSMKQMTRDYFVMRSLIRKESCYNADWRVSNLILELATREGIIQDGVIYLGQTHKKTHLANLLHMDRVTFYKCLTLLEDKGLCSEKDGMITINDLTALIEYRDSNDKKKKYGGKNNERYYT
jgi:CRP-like cAMP-binding protein